MTVLTVLPGVLYQVPPKPPFLIHLLTEPPILARQQQKISADSLAVTSTIQVPRSIWFGWNQVRLVDTRW